MYDRMQLHAEPPLKKVKALDDWLDLHFKVIQRLVEEPMFAHPRIGEPTMEVTVVGANLWGPWMHSFQNMLHKPFVRHYIDTEMIGETKKWDQGDPRTPRWQEKMLFLPRGAKVSQFEILNDTQIPLVLGDCALSTETVWTTAKNCGRYLLDLPILHQGNEVGKIQLRFSMWNGRPLEEENPMLGHMELQGTLAGAMDNDYIGSGLGFARNPVPDSPFRVTGPMGMIPMTYNGAMPQPGFMNNAFAPPMSPYPPVMPGYGPPLGY